jgi:outer membrane protein OmpA-like peptidoglycan-associated protein
LCLWVETAAWAGRGGVDVEQFRTEIDGRGLFTAESAEIHAPGEWGAGLVLHYARRPLVLRAAGERGLDLVGDRLTGSVVLSLGVLRWLELGAEVPVALLNIQDAAREGGTSVTGLGALRFQPKLRFLSQDRHGIALSLIPSLVLPTGNHNAFLSQNGVVFSPGLVLERRLGPVRLLASLGYTAREPARYLDLTVDDEIFWELGVGLRLHQRLELGAEILGRTAAAAPFGGDEAHNPLEVVAGLRLFLGDRLQVQFGMGRGLSHGYGSPGFRLFAGLIFAPHSVDTDGDGVPDDQDRCPRDPGPRENQGCPRVDTDGDGVPDDEDRCPSVPGPRENRGCPWPDKDGDGVPDKDDKCPDVSGPKENQGCPWPDTDGDGVPDKDDQCPTVFGPRENRGCPWPDTDGDGIPDKDDKCPTVLGPPENRGCPWPDTDGDGIPDREDDCPSVPGPRENRGCPWPDRDGDGIPDKDDKCPSEPGPRENQGCPWPKVEVTKREVVIREAIHFRSGSAEILPQSYEIIAAVAKVLADRPDIRRVEVQGHTDDIGNASFNRRLSQKRAEAVRQRLVLFGIASSRLVAKGYGADRPLRRIERRKMSAAELKAARAQNRRVQFVIVKQ